MKKPHVLTLYKNLDPKQLIEFRAVDRERCILELREWATNANGVTTRERVRILNGELKTIVGIGYATRPMLCDGLSVFPFYPKPDDDAIVTLRYVESYDDWEVEVNDDRYESAVTSSFPFQEALDDFVNEVRMSDTCWSDESEVD